MLTVLDRLPSRLLAAEAARLHEVLPGPTLFHLPGRRQEPLFVAVLQHGDEVTGWEALRALLSRYQGRELPRAISIFIGNVAAAAQAVRFLPGQPDYNRMWAVNLGTNALPEQHMMRQVVDEMRARRVFASVDVHNNTGINPHYACVRSLDAASLQLATLFSRTVVYFTKPDGVQTAAFAPLCPAVTIECGRPGDPHGALRAAEFLEACLHLSAVPAHPVAPHDMDLFRAVAIAKVPEDVSLGVGRASDADLRLVEDLDHLNFRELPAGTLLGWAGPRARLEVRDKYGRDVARRYFSLRGGELRLATAVMLSMLTLNLRAIRQDCFCYLMEHHPDFRGAGRAPGVKVRAG